MTNDTSDRFILPSTSKIVPGAGFAYQPIIDIKSSWELLSGVSISGPLGTVPLHKSHRVVPHSFELSEITVGQSQRKNSPIIDEYVIRGNDLRDLVNIAARAAQRKVDANEVHDVSDPIIALPKLRTADQAVIQLTIVGPLMVFFAVGLLIVSYIGQYTLIDPLVGVVTTLFGLTFYVMGKIDGA